MGFSAHYRFMAMVRIEDGPIPGSPCHIWLGAKSKGGGKRQAYGTFKYEGKAVRCHVWICENITKLACPKGYERHHICENTLCVCPEHIEVVTQQINNWHRWKDGYETIDYPPFFK